jgi:uncharacterized pyridoxal phosphate-containing UPF0001 family protein
VLPVLLQFNVSVKPANLGDAWQEQAWPGLLNEIEQILALPGLSVRGLMTMPPLSLILKLRPYFRRLKHLQRYLSECFSANWNELSMGMSNDFEIAVQEGATSE